MGFIVILSPILAILLVIISFTRILMYVLSKQIGLKEIILGLTTSLIFFGILCLSYIINGKAWGLGPVFGLPIVMIIIPFIIHSFTEKSKNKKLAYFSLVLLISIGITTILGIIFNDLPFELLDFLGIEKYY